MLGKPFRSFGLRASRAVATIVISVGCVGGERADGGTDAPVVRIASPSLILDLSPRETWGYYEAQIAGFVFEGLTRVGTGGVEPALAHSWTVSPDGSTYRFALRSGVRFHDGTSFSARDVVRAWSDALSGSTGGVTHPWALDPIDGTAEFARGDADSIRGLRVEDDTTMVVSLTRPLGIFPVLLSLPQVAVSAASSGPLRPIGTGPWRWTSGGGRGDDEIRYARNEAYWDDPPRLDSLVYRFVPDSMVEDAFESGWVDLVSDVRPETRIRWSTRSDVGFLESEAVTFTRLVFNMLEPVFADVRVRRALNHAIPAAQLATAAGAPNPVAASGVIPPSYDGADANRVPYAFDPARARALLEEAEFPLRRPVRLWVPAPGLADYPADIGPLLQDYLEAIGLTVELTVQNEGIETALVRRLADVTLSVWVGDYADPDAYLYPLFHSGAAGTAGNEGSYRNPQVDRAIDAAREASDPGVRASLVRTADSLIFVDAPAVFLWFTRTATAYSLRLEGWSANPLLSRFTSLRLGPGARAP